MLKKLAILGVLALLLVPGLLAGPATGSEQKATFAQAVVSAEPVKLIQNTEPDTDDIQAVLKSVTLRDLIDGIKTRLQSTNGIGYHRHILRRSMQQGMERLTQLGISPDMTIGEVNDALTTGIFFNKKSDQYLPFMIDVLPTICLVSVQLEPMVYNLSEDNPSDLLTYRLEIFAKLIPFIDFVVTDHVGILRTLSQSTLFFPAVGARLMLGRFTIAILAFGPRIHWIRL